MKKYLFVLLFLFSCSGIYEPTKNDYQYMENGVVVYNNFSGGFYGIISNDSICYFPLNLSSQYKKNGTKIMFDYQYKKYQNTTVMWGIPITITKINYRN